MPTPPTAPATGVAPQFVALIRGIVIAAVLAAVAGVVTVLTDGSLVELIPAGWRPLALVLVPVVVRYLEGVVDQARGQAAQAGPFGSAPATATAYIDTTGEAVAAAAAQLDDAAIARTLDAGAVVTQKELEAAITVSTARLEGMAAKGLTR